MGISNFDNQGRNQIQTNLQPEYGTNASASFDFGWMFDIEDNPSATPSFIAYLGLRMLTPVSLNSRPGYDTSVTHLWGFFMAIFFWRCGILHQLGQATFKEW
jgi:hypothetical protein